MSKPSLKPVLPRIAGLSSPAILLLVLMLFFPIAEADAATRKGAISDKSWSDSVQVSEENPVCGTLEKSMQKHLLEITALLGAIEKDRTGPAPSLAGLFKNWLGQPYTSEALKRKEEQLQRTRRRADTLNDLLNSAGCARIDIDSELQKLVSKKPSPGGH